MLTRRLAPVNSLRIICVLQVLVSHRENYLTGDFYPVKDGAAARLACLSHHGQRRNPGRSPSVRDHWPAPGVSAFQGGRIRGGGVFPVTDS